jgi:hypothetical protein
VFHIGHLHGIRCCEVGKQVPTPNKLLCVVRASDSMEGGSVQKPVWMGMDATYANGASVASGSFFCEGNSLEVGAGITKSLRPTSIEQCETLCHSLIRAVNRDDHNGL